MFVVISYDITDDGRRTKVCNTLKDYGEHVQYSVFECYLNSSQIEKLKAELEMIINPREDSIRYYTLCRSCIEKIKVQGRTKVFDF